ncbi:hypothetical protein BMT70_21235, partial [Escherichia coli]
KRVFLVILFTSFSGSLVSRIPGAVQIGINPDANHRYSVAWLPVFAAAVASGNASFESVFDRKPGAVFFLRQVRDFDSRWFKAIFQFSLLRYVAKK